MTIPLRIDDEHRQVFTRADGVITLKDVRAHLEQEHRGNGLGYVEMVDARTMVPRFSRADIREIVDFYRQLGTREPLGPTAVLVSSDHAFGMMRMLETMTQEFALIRPFRDEAEAHAWLSAVSGRPVLSWPADRFPPPGE